jgi:hypothetical protein
MSMSDKVAIAIIGLAPTLVAFVMGLLNYRQGRGIHVLVNSKMTAALAEIERLKKGIAQKAKS